jgi:hypothetical protein
VVLGLLVRKFSYQGLDLVELRAFYASLPLRFDADGTGKKVSGSGSAWPTQGSCLLSLLHLTIQPAWSSSVAEAAEPPLEHQ